MRHIISVLLENEPGALSRVAGLFSARGYNIESLTVSPAFDQTLSRMTIVTIGDDRKIDQIEKQLGKLVDVVALSDLTVSRHIERELGLIKVQVTSEQKADLNRVVDLFEASLVDVDDDAFIVELSGTSQKLDELVKALSIFTIVEVARTGVTGLASNKRSLIGNNTI